MLIFLLFADIAVATPAAHWLTGRDALPAFAAGGGVIAEARDDDCRWVKKGSRWHEIGKLGERLGETCVQSLDISEPWPCRMASFDKRGKTRLLLEAAATPPAPTPSWEPGDENRSNFLRRIGHPRYHRREALFFQLGGEQWAVGAGRQLTVGRWKDGAWSTQALIVPKSSCHDLGVVDLDGDGRPEIIAECWEDSDYRDVIFKLDGVWKKVAESLYGNTV
jgi:hypothetical protein